VEADGLNKNPKLINFTAISSAGGTALQIKKESGARLNNIFIVGYNTNLQMSDNGPVGNVKIDGSAASISGNFKTRERVDISSWSWINARL
tara:strand:+ start:872 stop:1144 length:273 start_codon:yes stop_codon:yes gene_type:complete